MDDTALKDLLGQWKHLATEPAPDAVDRLCDVYLSATSEQRQHIRSTFDDDALFRRVFDPYARYIQEQLSATGDVKWLRRGLVIHSIEDNRLDWRDVLVALSGLWLLAERSGIDPAPSFQEVAAMSSAVPRYDANAMQGLMAGIGTSACLAEMRRSVTGQS